MKIRVEFDISAKEFREALGLPDFEPLQNEVLGLVRDRIVGAIETLDPKNLFRLVIPENLQSLEAMQKFLREIVSRTTGKE